MAAVPVAKQSHSVRQLIFGMNGSGRTYRAFEAAKNARAIMYVGFAKNGVVDIDHPATAKTTCITVNSWVEFDSQVLVPARKGELGVDAIIVDDYETAIEYLTDPSGVNSQQQWGILTAKVVTAITTLASHIDKQKNGLLVVTTVLADDEETGKRDFTFNPSSKSRLLPKFNLRHYAYVTKKGFGVQTQSAQSLKFMTAKE